MKTISLIIILSTVLLSSPGNVKVRNLTGENHPGLNISKEAKPEYKNQSLQPATSVVDRESEPVQNGTINSPMVSDYDPDYTYLRFDVSDYMPEAEIIPSELPENDLSYLKFDVTAFDSLNPVSMDELPEQEYSYLKFDVMKYIDQENSGTSVDYELPQN